MKKLTACCGPDFETCEARLAAQCDDALCRKAADRRSKQNGAAWDLNGCRTVALRERPELMERAAAWFHGKWGVPEEAYRECMAAYLGGRTENGWYLCLEGDRIVGGLGVIDNDFHDRTDLAPNVCAVYTEPDARGRGVAGRLLALAVEDMRHKGVTPLYLVTDLTGFYERYGWTFLCMAREADSSRQTRVYVHS